MAARIKGDANNGSYLYIDYDVSQNVGARTSTITWVAGIHFGSYYFNIHNALITMSTTLSGVTLSGTTTTGTYNSGWPLSGAGPNMDWQFKSGSTVVHHNSAGAGNIKFTGSANWDTPINFTSNFATTVTLPTIANTPSAPAKPILSNIQPTSVVVTWTPPASNGATITGYQVGYNTTSTAPITLVSGTSPKTITGLTPGTNYWFWVRAQNSVGWGPWSPSTSLQTIAGAHILVGGVWKVAIPYVRVAGVWKMAQPFVRVSGVWKGSD